MKKSKGRRPITRQRVAQWLERRFLLRLHMFWIVTGAFLAGLLATKLMVAAHLDVLALRYVIAVLVSYFAFLLFIRMWIWYVGIRGSGSDADLSFDVIDFGTRAAAEVADLELGGGSFGGAGATGSWGDAAAAAPKSVAGKSSLPGCGFDIDLDGGALVILALLIALIGAIVFASVYVIWLAPTILAEAAFEAALAAMLARRAKKLERSGWVGKVWRATVWPLIAIVIVSAALGIAVQRYCPGAKRLRDALHCADVRNPVATPRPSGP